MNFKTYMPLLLLLSFIVLTGAEPVDPDDITGAGGGSGFGCSGIKGCRGRPIAPEPEGGISASTFYSINRAEMGGSLNTVSSGSETYRASTQLGHFLSQGRTLSDKYLVRHPMSRKVPDR